ncbi:FkbM family methyltransferase [Plantactinospora sp. CA-294935]|uniref:FkbM family methyltransferase n=1 Tax=Plantactinospora sp. CA-294935 TaxID=3240012 RepID=UPI003D90BB52
MWSIMAGNIDAKRSAALVELLKPERLPRILDVGANPLGWDRPPYQTLVEQGLCELWGVEPQEDAYQKLLKTKRENEHYLPNAIGQGGAATLHIFRNDAFSSMYPIHGPSIDFIDRWRDETTLVKTIDLETHRIDDLSEMENVDLLKIDCQGYEVEAMRGGQKRLADAVAIIPEVRFMQLYDSEPNIGGLDSYLRSRGFFFHKFLFVKSTGINHSRFGNLPKDMTWNQAVDGDAVYIKNPVFPEMATEQVKYLAIFADAVFFSFELVIRCLDILAARGVVSDADIQGYFDRLVG